MKNNNFAAYFLVRNIHILYTYNTPVSLIHDLLVKRSQIYLSSTLRVMPHPLTDDRKRNLLVPRYRSPRMAAHIRRKHRNIQ